MTVDTRTFEERLRDAGYLDTKPAATHPTAPASTPRTDTAAHRYLANAVANKVENILAATEGSRNDTLNAAAYSLGRLVAGAGLDRNLVEQQLVAAALTVGLDPSEIRNTIASGLAGGEKEPRAIPDLHVVPEVPTISAFEENPDAATAYIHEHMPRIDWHKLWTDPIDEEWIIEPLLPARRLVALYSPPKVGKSLLMLEIAVAIATGTPVLGVTPDRARRVLYVDFENDPQGDILERLKDMRRRPEELDNLVYLSFPSLAALDSERGGNELHAALQVYGCEVVVIDTVSRAIAGEENDNDTWLAFYRNTGLKMKKAGASLIRLDHTGKDEARGQRGGSAKSGDVDAIWKLSRVTDDTYQLHCDDARMPIAEKTLVLSRQSGPLRHQVAAAGGVAAWDAKVELAARTLDAAGLGHDAGRPKAREVLRAAGVQASNRVIGAALERRRRPVPEWRGQVYPDDLSPDSGDRSGTGEV